jgi:hypothetical protein
MRSSISNYRRIEMTTETELIKQTCSSDLIDALYFGARDEGFTAIVKELAERGVDLETVAQRCTDEMCRWVSAECEYSCACRDFHDDLSDAIAKLAVNAKKEVV